MRRPVRLVLAAALLLALAAPVAAGYSGNRGQAERERETFEISEVFAQCDGFDIVENATIRITRKTFRDDAGDVRRTVEQVHVDGTFDHSVTGEVLSRDPARFKVIDDVEEGTLSFLGLVFRIEGPDGQIVALDKGKLVLDRATEEVISEEGPHQIFHEEVDLCAAFS